MLRFPGQLFAPRAVLWLSATRHQVLQGQVTSLQRECLTMAVTRSARRISKAPVVSHERGWCGVAFVTTVHACEGQA